MIAWKQIGVPPFSTSRTSRPLQVCSIWTIRLCKVIADAFLTSQRSQRETSMPSTSFSLMASPGSAACIQGTARFKKIFLWSVTLHPLSILTSSKVCSPEIEAVVVANAGTILPALSLTVIQSMGSSLQQLARQFPREYMKSMWKLASLSFSNSSDLTRFFSIHSVSPMGFAAEFSLLYKVKKSCLSQSISSRSSFFSSSGSLSFFSSSSAAAAFLVDSLSTDYWIALALSSLATKAGGVKPLAISPQSFLKSSVRGVSDGS